MSENNIEIEKSPIFKKWWFWAIVVIVIFIIFIAVIFSSKNSATSNNGMPISIKGQVLQVLEDSYRIDSSKAMNDSNYDNIIVVYNTAGSTIKEDDYVSIEGNYLGVTSYKSTMGYEISAHKIQATSIKKSSYIDAVSPTIKGIELNKTMKQYGYSVTVQKVELAETETRVYLKIVNNGKSNFNLYSFNASITQNGKQFEEQTNYDGDYPEIQSNIRVGITSEGIIIFPKLEETSFKIILDGSSDNYNEDISEFVFDVEI